MSLFACDKSVSGAICVGCDVNCSTEDVLGWEFVDVDVVVAVLFDVSASLKMGDVIIGEVSIVLQSNLASASLSMDCSID